MRHLAPSRAGRITLPVSAVEQVRCPDQPLALARAKCLALEVQSGDQLPPDLLESRIVVVGPGVAERRDTEVLVREDGEPVTPGVIDERPRIFVNVLERHSDAAHEPLGYAAEMHGVRVKVLLCAYRKVQGLERKGAAPVDEGENLQH